MQRQPVVPARAPGALGGVTCTTPGKPAAANSNRATSKYVLPGATIAMILAGIDRLIPHALRHMPDLFWDLRPLRVLSAVDALTLACPGARLGAE